MSDNAPNNVSNDNAPNNTQSRPYVLIDDYNLADAEKKLIENALAKTDGCIAQAAPLLGIDRYSLKRKIVKHNIEWSARNRHHGHRLSRTAKTAV